MAVYHAMACYSTVFRVNVDRRSSIRAAGPQQALQLRKQLKLSCAFFLLLLQPNPENDGGDE